MYCLLCAGVPLRSSANISSNLFFFSPSMVNNTISILHPTTRYLWPTTHKTDYRIVCASNELHGASYCFIALLVSLFAEGYLYLEIGIPYVEKRKKRTIVLLARPVVVEPGFLDLFVNDAPQFGVLFLPIHHMIIIGPATIVTIYKVMTVIHYIPEAPWDAP